MDVYNIRRLLSLLRCLFEDPRFPLFVFLMLPAVAYHFASPQVITGEKWHFQAKWRPKGLKFCVQEEGEVMYFGTRSTGHGWILVVFLGGKSALEVCSLHAL